MDEPDVPQGRAPDHRTEISGSQGVQTGDGNVQVNVLLDGGGRSAGPVVAGDVPQEPAAFQPREALAGVLESHPGSGDRVRVVYAVTGIRGVGKTQVAAAYARRRITDGWRLVAWVDATDEASLLAGLAQVAAAAGIGVGGENVQVLAAGVRHLLETDGEQRLLVFDNATDLDLLRPFLPAGGAGQVIITSSRRPAAGLGTPLAVDVFSKGEALAFLEERTGLDDAAGARDLSVELGFLPLGLAQAAALIARERLSYATYLGRLRSLQVMDYLRRTEGDAYPYRLAEAIGLSLDAVEERDRSGVVMRLMGLVAVLAETGVPREWLHLAAETGALGDGGIGAAATDAAVGDLADASLVGFSVDDRSVTAHRLVMRVVRERLATDGGLPDMVDGAVGMLTEVADGISEAWRDPAGVRDLAGQVSAIMNSLAVHPAACAGQILANLLTLRLRSVYLLNVLGDSARLVISVAEPLTADCERLLGADHPDTLAIRNSLAMAYRDAGRAGEAIALFERTLVDSERLLGADDPSTLTIRNNLAMAYQDAGRTPEAIALYERTLVDIERLLGTDHPDTIPSRTNLAMTYRATGRTGEAIALYERTLADCERLLGTDHPNTLKIRNNLAMAYQATGRIAEAIALYERTLADCERLLGTDHPDTLVPRNNLAMAYREAGRTAEAIPLLMQNLADCERLGSDHPHTLATRNSLAMVYQDAGRAAEATALLERTFADCERLLGTDHPNTLITRTNLAMAYQAANRIAEAIALCEGTLADCERLLGADHPHTLTTRNNLAMAYQDAGRTAEATALLERTLADCERLLGTDHPNTKTVRSNLASLTA
jgi:tetratricopeptide (TPR) repeat protein